jgi:ribosomal protein L28
MKIGIFLIIAICSVLPLLGQTATITSVSKMADDLIISFHGMTGMKYALEVCDEAIDRDRWLPTDTVLRAGYGDNFVVNKKNGGMRIFRLRRIGPPWVCPSGYICTPVFNPNKGTMTTPGFLGSISVTQNGEAVSKAYAGDQLVPILSFDVEAKGSDMNIQRVKLRMEEISAGLDTKFFFKIYKRLYVTVEEQLLSFASLDSSTVVRYDDDYYITIAGFNCVVPMNGKRTITIKADLYESIAYSDIDSEVYKIELAANGIRSLDGSGVDNFAGSTTENNIGQTATIGNIGSIAMSIITPATTDPSRPVKAGVVTINSDVVANSAVQPIQYYWTSDTGESGTSATFFPTFGSGRHWVKLQVVGKATEASALKWIDVVP